MAATLDVTRVRTPDLEGLVRLADERVPAPEHQRRTGDPLPRGRGGVVVVHVGRRAGAVVLARRGDGCGVEDADVVGHHLRLDDGAGSEQALDHRADPELGLVTEQPLGNPASGRDEIHTTSLSLEELSIIRQKLPFLKDADPFLIGQQPPL